MAPWDPDRYLTYADERTQPFLDLLSRVPTTDPRTVVDLGCGPGQLTRLLKDRWPAARVTGVDSSPEMVARAREVEGIEVVLADLRGWLGDGSASLGDGSVSPRDGSASLGDGSASLRDGSVSPRDGSVSPRDGSASPRDGSAGRVDVLVSNATLQWVPRHLDLLPALVRRLIPGGWLAVQVPGNFEEPSHTLRRELAAEAPYAAHTRDLDSPASHDPGTYLDALAALGCTVQAWETTYLHVLTGPDPVFTWVSGTGARPTLEALDAVGLREPFEAELKRRLRAAYPARPYGVVLPFRRVFAVAQAGPAAAAQDGRAERRAS